MLADKDSLLDEVVQVLWDVWGQTLGLKHTKDLVASDKSHLGNTVTVSKNHTFGEKNNTSVQISLAANFFSPN